MPTAVKAPSPLRPPKRVRILSLALPQTWGLTTKGSALGGRHAGYRVYRCKDGHVAANAGARDLPLVTRQA